MKLVKWLLTNFFLVGLFFTTSVFAQLEPYVESLINITSEIKALLEEDDNILDKDIHDLLVESNNLNDQIKTSVNVNNVLLESNRDILRGGQQEGVWFDGIVTWLRRFEVYLAGVHDLMVDVVGGVEGYVRGEEYLGIYDYLQKIYEFIVRPPVNPNFQPEVRYYGFQNVDSGAKKKIDEVAKRLDHLIQYGQYKDDVRLVANYVNVAKNAARERPLNYPVGAGHTKYYSAISAQSIFDADQYDDELQRQAAETFIQNLVGNVTVPVLRDADPKSDNALEYVIYQKAMSAIQSVAARNIAQLYAERFPVEYIEASISTPKTMKSKLQLLKEMNTFYPSLRNYWLDENGIGNLGLAQKALAFFDSFFALNFSLNRIYEQLERAGLQLSLITIQNTFLSKVMYGNMLYDAAKKSKVIEYPGVEPVGGAAARRVEGEEELVAAAKEYVGEEGITEEEAREELGMTEEELEEAGITESDFGEVFGTEEDEEDN
jgi:hypothetical protein